MVRDILSELMVGVLSEDQADEILSTVLDSPQADKIENLLGFSHAEWTAYAQGALLVEIASWRKNGWPVKCNKCGGAIDVDQFGWLVIDSDGESVLKHIRCPQQRL